MTDDPIAPTSWEIAPRRLTHLQARSEQRLYWSQKSPADRLTAAAALTKRSYDIPTRSVIGAHKPSILYSCHPVEVSAAHEDHTLHAPVAKPGAPAPQT